MRTTIDSAGRIVVPKAIRDRLGLRGGEPLDISERDGRIEIQPAATPIRLVESDGELVAVADDPLPTLTDDEVRSAIEQTRR